MRLRTGNMWDSYSHFKLFIGNATVRRDGCLVMGRGAALEAQTMFKGCNKVFGELVSRHLTDNAGSPYGLLISPIHHDPILGVFQVKWHYLDEADLDLIAYSTKLLKNCALFHWPRLTIAMNFPGIGFGRLNEGRVMSIISTLPDNVEVWRYK